MKSRFKSLGKAVLSLTRTNSGSKKTGVEKDQSHADFIDQVAAESKSAEPEKKDKAKAGMTEGKSGKLLGMKSVRKSASSLKSSNESASQPRASVESQMSVASPETKKLPSPEIRKLPVLDASAADMSAENVVKELLNTLKEAKREIAPLVGKGRTFADCVSILDELNTFTSQHRSTFSVLGKMAASVNGSEWRQQWTATAQEVVRMQEAISSADYELRMMIATKSKYSAQADRAIGDLHRAAENFRTAVQNLLPILKRGHLFPDSEPTSPSTPDRLPSRFLSSEDDYAGVDVAASASHPRTPLKDIQFAARLPPDSTTPVANRADTSPQALKAAIKPEAKRSLATNLSPSLTSQRSPGVSAHRTASSNSAAGHLYLPSDSRAPSSPGLTAPSPMRRSSVETKAEKLCVWGEACLARADGNIAPDQNYPAALQAFRQGAQLEHEQCQFRLGQMLRHGLGAPADFVEARKWLARASESGSVEAQWELAQVAELTQGVPAAEPMYRELAAIGQAAACVRVAQGVVRGEMAGDAEDVGALLEVAAAQGHSEGLNLLGMHLLQHEPAEGPGKAMECFQKAALLGNGAAMNNLGVCFEEGAVVERDVHASKGWYIQGAAVGNAHACNNLGFILMCEAQPEAAALLFDAAVQGGSADAMYNLGRLAELGAGVRQDVERAARLYEGAAKRRNAKAMHRLGCLLYSGTETRRADAARALACFKEAAMLGSGEASNSLGLMVENGEQVSRDAHRARQLYMEAANRGCADGAYNLGSLYEHGRGVKMNLAQAMQHYKLAASMGHAFAAVDVTRLELLLEEEDAERSVRGSPPGKGSPPRKGSPPEKGRGPERSTMMLGGVRGGDERGGTLLGIAGTGGSGARDEQQQKALAGTGQTSGDTTIGTLMTADDRSMAIEDIHELGGVHAA